MINLLHEIAVWIFQNTTPSRRSIRILRAIVRVSFWLCPLAALPFFLVGLHWQWTPGYVIAAGLTILPVVLMELTRRMVKPVSSTAEGVMSLLATPHTWFSIINLWLAHLEPGDEYVPVVYTAGIGIILFMILMGRWGKSPKWYKPLTVTGLMVPVVYGIFMLIGSAIAPATFAGLRMQRDAYDMQIARHSRGQSFDQNIVRSSRTADGYAEGADKLVRVNAGELLWRTSKKHEKKDDGLYYALYFREADGRTRQPDPKKAVWFPESMVTPETMPLAKVVTLPPRTNYLPDHHGKPSKTPKHISVPLEGAEVTSLCAYVDGKPYYFGRIHDRGTIYEVWWQVQYEAL